MQWMMQTGAVDHAKARRVALAQRYRFAVRPALSIDDRDYLERSAVVVIEKPLTQHQNVVTHRGPGRVDHDGAVELAVLPQPIGVGRTGKCAPVAVSAGHVQRKPKLSHSTGGNLQRIDRAAHPGAQIADHQRRIRPIAQRENDDGALRHAHQWPRHQRRFAALGKGEDR